MELLETIMLILTGFVIISVPLLEYIIDWEEEKREKAEQKKRRRIDAVLAVTQG